MSVETNSILITISVMLPSSKPVKYEIKERLSKLEEKIKKIEESTYKIAKTIKPIVRGINTAVTREWRCPECGEKGYVGIYIKCGACGHITWWGWWKE